MTKSQFSTLGAAVTLLLALRMLWPPMTSWWPLQNLFWPLILLFGALLLICPQKLPARLQNLANHPEFGAFFTAIVWAQFWLHGGFFWLLAALPLALAHWRGPNWNWNLGELCNGSRRVWFGAAVVALITLRLTWMSVEMNTGSYLTGGMHYGLNQYNYSTGYYEWGFQWSPAMNIVPGINYEIPFLGVELKHGVWPALLCWLLLVACTRRDFELSKWPQFKYFLGAMLLWWGCQLVQGDVKSVAGWVFGAVIGFLLYTLHQQKKLEASV